MASDNCCPVCFEDLDGLIRAVLPCEHTLCLGCFVQLRNFTCMLCRLDFEPVVPEKIRNSAVDQALLDVYRSSLLLHDSYLLMLGSRLRSQILISRARRLLGDDDELRVRRLVGDDEAPLIVQEEPDDA